MKITSYSKISKYLMAPALISLLVGCGSPENSNTTQAIALENTQTVLETNVEDVTEDNYSIEPMFIDFSEKETRSTGTQIYNGDNQTASNWVIFDDTPEGAEVKSMNLEGDNIIFLDGCGIKNGFSLRQNDGSYLNNTEATDISWESKFYDDYIIYVAVKLDDGSVKYLAYRPRFAQNHDEVLTFKLPDITETGVWTTTSRDLEADLHQYLPERSIESVIDFQVRGKGCLDDIELSSEIASDDNMDNNDNTDPDSVDVATSSDDYNLTIDANYNISVSSSVSMSGHGTNINQEALATQLAADLQARLDALLVGVAPTAPSMDPNAQMEALMQEFETQLSAIITLLMQTQALPDGSATDADIANFNNQMAALLSMLTQMQGMTTDPTSGITVDLNVLMEQFQVSMEPMMSVIPQMFEMADKGMDMMDPEKYIPEMMMMAGEMLEFSKYMVDTAASLMRDPNVDHELYVNAMLRLSDDIGLMADRILVMADKMLVMGDKMEEVALKMLDMMGDTQTNLLTAQENFNALLLGLAGRS